VRTKKHGGDVESAIKKDGYIGLYVDSGALNAQKFFGKGLSDEKWQSIFGYYFEMWLVHHFLIVLKDIPDSKNNQMFFDVETFIKTVSNCFDTDVSNEFNSLEGLIEFLTRLRKDVDYRSNNAALRPTFDDLQIRFSSGELIFGTAAAFKECCPEIGAAAVCYMIDEAENFSSLQQTFFNSLIRFRKGRVTFKIGARLYGIHTNDTMNDGEPIKRGSEFEEVHLDDYLRNLGPKAYQDFAAKLIARRLNLAGISCSSERERNLDIEFESVDQSRDFSNECLSILQSVDEGKRERPYFQKFKSTLKKHTSIEDPEINEIIEILKCDDWPLVEKANIVLFYREAISSGEEAIAFAQAISSSGQAYIAGDKAGGHKHVSVLDYYKSDLLAQLYREARQPVAYCGFETIVTLSQGIPRNLLMLLKYIYRRSLFADERPFEGGKISKRSQTDGIKDGAQWFWEDAQPETNATSVRLSVEALALLFRTVRFSARPSEPALCAFSVRERDLTDEAKKTLKTAENWSYLIKIRHSGSDKNTQDRRNKYQIVPMLAPKWDISHTRRGTIELADDFANALFDEERRDPLGALFKKRTDQMLESGIFKEDKKQEKLL